MARPLISFRLRLFRYVFFKIGRSKTAFPFSAERSFAKSQNLSVVLNKITKYSKSFSRSRIYHRRLASYKLALELKLLVVGFALDLCHKRFGNGAADRRGPYGAYRAARNGAFVAAKVNSAGTDFVMMEQLAKVGNVSASSWIGDKSVLVNGRSYAVPETVLCYNEDSGRWTDLTSARNYGGTLDLYVRDGVVRVVACRSK